MLTQATEKFNSVFAKIAANQRTNFFLGKRTKKKWDPKSQSKIATEYRAISAEVDGQLVRAIVSLSGDGVNVPRITLVAHDCDESGLIVGTFVMANTVGVRPDSFTASKGIKREHYAISQEVLHEIVWKQNKVWKEEAIARRLTASLDQIEL